MYRYSVDNAVTYTSEDFVLFRESPFASWMERLTLENPEHGIPPDIGSKPPLSGIERQDDVAETLRSEDREVALINWDEDESRRRAATLDAMRGGVDFIVNGQLALGPLSGTVNLLMRTSGYSDFGGFLYIPCDTQGLENSNRAFRLCFLADLLHSLQGQLPPQMLIIRGGVDLEPMQTEEHIYHYRAVKQRFMEAMRNFRKHRMPDPAESSHFGRWSDCANEVLRQRALRDAETPAEDVAPEILDSPVPLAATADGLPLYELDSPAGQAASQIQPEQAATELNMTAAAGGVATVDLHEASVASQPVAFTLAEQALLLTPGAYAAEAREHMPGSTPNLEASGYVAVHEAPAVPEEPVVDELVVAEMSLADANVESQELDIQPGLDQIGLEPDRRQDDPRAERYQPSSSDVALDNLQFIGSRHLQPQSHLEEELPPPNAPDATDDFESQDLKPHPLDSAGFNISIDSVIDMDAPVPPASPPPVLETSDIELVTEDEETSAYDLDGMIGRLDIEEEPSGEEGSLTAFSDSLITNEDFPR